MLLVLGALGYAGWLTWSWYAQLPKLPTVGWITSMSNAPDPDTQFYPQMLTASFDQSVVRLDLINKDVSSYVTLSPN